jgi:hypothetical protein
LFSFIYLCYYSWALKPYMVVKSPPFPFFFFSPFSPPFLFLSFSYYSRVLKRSGSWATTILVTSRNGEVLRTTFCRDSTVIPEVIRPGRARGETPVRHTLVAEPVRAVPFGTCTKSPNQIK